MRRFKVCLIPGVIVIAAGVLLATTWAPTMHECPVCHTKNSFSDIMSYGSYIYSWPSKFQDIFWPATDGNSLYSCKHCHLTLFMWDFKELPAAKIEDVRHALSSTSLEGKYERYTDIPMSKRLEIAEKVYSVLDKDDVFWSWFYRVQGYHLAREKNREQAHVARVKALDSIRKQLNSPENAGKQKELLLASGAMHHFLGEEQLAKNDLGDALKLTFSDPKMSDDQNKNVNANLDQLLKEYLERIDEKTVPNDDGSDEKAN
jgi:hypothetical protein